MTAVYNYLGVKRDNDEYLFSTYFPSYSDFMLLHLTTIRTVYYMGDADDAQAVQFLNMHTLHQTTNGFELINIKF